MECGGADDAATGMRIVGSDHEACGARAGARDEFRAGKGGLARLRSVLSVKARRLAKIPRGKAAVIKAGDEDVGAERRKGK